jgi:hypothetical protein
MSFLPDNYQAPRSSNYYMKLVEGENRIRIMSRPIFGWEDWKDNKPVRFTMDKKPVKSFDPKKPVRHFWAFVVFNQQEEQIQILHVTQASIRKSLEALCKDNDWGDPYAYDIKIMKTGEGVDTEYAVNPVPHKPADDYMITCFSERPCYLEALFDNADPFSAEWGPDKRTPRATAENKPAVVQEKKIVSITPEKKVDDRKITQPEVDALAAVLSKCSEEYVQSVHDFMKKHGIDKYGDISKEVYEKMMVKANEDKDKKARKG